MKNSKKLLEIKEKINLVKKLQKEIDDLRNEFCEKFIEEVGFPIVEKGNPILCRVEYEVKRYGGTPNERKVIDKVYVSGYSFRKDSTSFVATFHDVPVPTLMKVKKDGSCSLMKENLAWSFIPESIEIYPIQK